MENINETLSGLINYEFSSKCGTIKVSFEDCEQNPRFRIEGPKNILSKAIGGIGGESGLNAWATEKELNTEAKRMYAILEIIKAIKEN